jgi:hypothetical protein
LRGYFPRAERIDGKTKHGLGPIQGEKSCEEAAQRRIKQEKSSEEELGRRP